MGASGDRKGFAILCAIVVVHGLDVKAPSTSRDTYRTFVQASRVNFDMEPYGNRRYVIDYACHAGAVAVEKSSIRLLVVANCPLEVGRWAAWPPIGITSGLLLKWL